MVTTTRSTAQAVWYIPEATYGVDPGIVAAQFVDGATETYLYIPKAEATACKAYARIVDGVEGLPKRPLVAAEQVFPTTDADPFMAKGTRGGDTEFSFSMLMHGGLADTIGAAPRPVPPPWLQLASSASGRIIGHRTGDSGGEVGGSSVKAAPTPTANRFVIEASGGGAVGALAPGHVFFVDHNTGSSPYDWEPVRPTYCASVTEFGDNDSDPGGGVVTRNGAEYSGYAVGFKQAPTAGDNILFTSQANFDRRYEDSGAMTDAEGQLSYTILVLRADADASFLFTGCRCNAFEITDNVNEIPKIKLTFKYKSWKRFGEDGTSGFGGTPTIDDEPAYYENWPCPKVTSQSNMTFLKAYMSSGAYQTPTVVRDLAVTNFSLTWNAGYTVRHSNMATEGVEDLRQTARQELRVKFTTLFYDDWQDMLGMCSTIDSNTLDSFPFLYWTGEDPRQTWYVAIPSAHVVEDPGADKDFEGNLAQEITLGIRPYRGDGMTGTAGDVNTPATVAAFDTDATAQNKFALGTLAIV